MFPLFPNLDFFIKGTPLEGKIIAEGDGFINIETGERIPQYQLIQYLQRFAEQEIKKQEQELENQYQQPTDGTGIETTNADDKSTLDLEKQLLRKKFEIGNRQPTEDEKFDILSLETGIAQRKLQKEQQQKIQGFTKSFESDATTRRKSLVDMLAQSDIGITEQFGKDLLTQGQETFKQANPFILEDLNRRGLFTSPSEVANAQSRALQALATQNQGELSELTTGLRTDTRNRLAGFDESVFNQLNELKGGGLNLALEGGQNVLDEAFSLKRSQLNRAFDVADADREERMAKYIARKNRRNQLVSSLIQAGGDIIGGFMGGK